MKYAFFLVLAVTCLSCAQHALSAAVPENLGDTWQDVTSLANAKSWHEAHDLVKAITAKRDASVAKLVNILRDDKQPRGNRLGAAKVLGDLKAAEALDALLENLTVSPEVLDETSLATYFPCYQALISIGIPASRKIVVVLRGEENDRRKKLLCTILKVVEGQAVSEFLLNAEIQKTKDEKEQQNLQNALKMVSEK